MDRFSFDDKRIAEGYADRPWLHKTVIERIVTDCDLREKFRNGLDVGCGAGLSTKALKLICEKVTGTDIAESMIQMCRKLYDDSEYCFYTCAAERIMVPENLYDIVTAAGVINWVDREAFLEKLREIMAPKGLLVIYDLELSDQMKDNAAYTDWYHDSYQPAFPRPPRAEVVWKQEDIGNDFTIKKQVKYQMEYKFTLDTFIDYMMVQSNVNIQIKQGVKTEKEIRNWMDKTLQPIFRGEKRTLFFNGYSWYIGIR
ncbi:MAG: class I SAM-dependent methyltransferase [Lachnospiraceae bacterium]